MDGFWLEVFHHSRPSRLSAYTTGFYSAEGSLNLGREIFVNTNRACFKKC